MRDEIRKYLMVNRATQDVGEFADGDSLLESGVIDSVSMIDLITHLETTYGISIDEDDMVPENFDSIDSMAAYVMSKRDGTLSVNASSVSPE